MLKYKKITTNFFNNISSLVPVLRRKKIKCVWDQPLPVPNLRTGTDINNRKESFILLELCNFTKG